MNENTFISKIISKGGYYRLVMYTETKSEIQDVELDTEKPRIKTIVKVYNEGYPTRHTKILTRKHKIMLPLGIWNIKNKYIDKIEKEYKVYVLELEPFTPKELAEHLNKIGKNIQVPIHDDQNKCLYYIIWTLETPIVLATLGNKAYTSITVDGEKYAVKVEGFNLDKILEDYESATRDKLETTIAAVRPYETLVAFKTTCGYLINIIKVEIK